MGSKSICFVVALSIGMFVPSQITSQDTKESNRIRETPTPKAVVATPEAIAPAVQNGRHALGERTRVAGLSEHVNGFSESQEAERFMQLKAVVVADLNRLGKSSNTKPTKVAPIGDAELVLRNTRNATVNKANGIWIRKSPAQVKNAEPSVISASAVGAKP